ncbi:MAG: HAD-IA family hydrolase [Candidatus Latescibacteria bacterium]|nr:HAD-IA family hydrolase [Candidatus Latescibacterota bacterium]
MIKAVVFDLDNTLMDFMTMKDNAINAAVTAMIDAGLTMQADEAKKELYAIYDREGIEFQTVFDSFLEKHLGYIDWKILSSGVVAYRKAREASLVLYPHVNLTLMELLRRGLKLAVLSDAPRREAWLRLCSLQLQHTFDTVIAFDDTGFRKPHATPYRKVLSIIKTEPNETLMLGDWPERDLVGAREVGMLTVFARYGFAFDRLPVGYEGADYAIDDIREILEIIDEFNKG